jgi:DNA processing protein
MAATTSKTGAFSAHQTALSYGSIAQMANKITYAKKSNLDILCVDYKLLRLANVKWNEEDSLIALNSMAGMGPARINKIIDSGQLIEFMQRHVDAAQLCENAARQRQIACEVGAQFVPRWSSYYPELFSHLDHPPPLLHVLGDLELLNKQPPAVAIIGARACTAYGREQANLFGKSMAFAQETIISGAARGIDMISMQSSVSAGGKVIAVLGSGLDICYPREAFQMLEQIIAQGGLVLSEFAFGTRPLAGHFPRRNRLIAAMSRAIFVIQATQKSGTMNTTDWALRLGKDVYALPGPIDDIACSGTNWLISEGATPVLSREDFLRSLQRTAHSNLNDELMAIVELFAEQDWFPHEISEQLCIDDDQVQMQLLELELQGRLSRTTSGSYRLIGPK